MLGEYTEPSATMKTIDNILGTLMPIPSALADGLAKLLGNDAAGAAQDPGAAGADAPGGTGGAAGPRASVGGYSPTAPQQNPAPSSGASVIPWVIGLAVLGIGGAIAVSALRKKR